MELQAIRYQKEVFRLNQEEKYIQMTTTPIPKLVCSLAVPTIISMLITSFYNMADTFFVGKLDTQSTAAVGVVFSIMAIIQAVGFFFGHGSGNYISRMLGSKDEEEARIMAADGFFLAFFGGIVLMILGILFLHPLALVLGSTPTILPHTKSYLRVILFGTPFMTSSLVLNNQLRFQGRASFAMVGIVTGAVLNIVLDPILIFTFHLGVAGAAVATVTSQFVSFLLLLVIAQRKGSIIIQIKNLKVNFYYLKEIFRGGIPSLCRQGLASIAVMTLNHAAGNYGDAAIAGMSIVNRITMFANSALIGFGQGFQPVCGFNYGAKLYERVREGFYFCVKYAFVFLVAVSVLCGIFAPDIVALFRREDQAVIDTGTLALRLQCITFPLNSWIVMSNMMLQAIGKALKASAIAGARQGYFFIPILLILSTLFGLFGVQMSQPAADVCTLILSIPLALSVLSEMKAMAESKL